MPPLTRTLQVNRSVRLSLSTRSAPAEPPRSGTPRARSRLATLGGLKLGSLAFAARTPERGLPGSGRKDSQPVQPAMAGSQLSGVLAVIDVMDRVTVPPLLKMPPPAAAVLPITWR